MKTVYRSIKSGHFYSRRDYSENVFLLLKFDKYTVNGIVIKRETLNSKKWVCLNRVHTIDSFRVMYVRVDEEEIVPIIEKAFRTKYTEK